uniref:Uncharacterized protein n=1 Tax=Nelumbo nucifera TaxID=4432 RepID=A0A822XSC7_NELNU|nr:TPA_asm: hypothetical protein HUJ06_024700 [Nelumbo nucifera]
MSRAICQSGDYRERNLPKLCVLDVLNNGEDYRRCKILRVSVA